MRISVIGQAAFGEAAFKRLIADGVEITAVSAPEPRDPSRADALWQAAAATGVPTVDTVALKKAPGQARWKEICGDLTVMVFVTEILPADVLRMPALGTIQYHPSLLPIHRGSSAMNWAIIGGEAETGLTIFWPDRGVDTGPILLQERCPIGPQDTVGSIYFDRLFPMGVDAIAKSVGLVAAGNAPRTEQDHALATYEPPCSDEHAQVRWYEPADRVSALIRGCNPQPGAWTTYVGEKLRIFDCRLTGEQEPGMPGRVLRVDDDGFDVRLNGGVLRVSRVQAAGQRKGSASEWARLVGLKEGFRFA